MIPTDKFDVLNNYNHMIELALHGKDNFPDEVCNFLVNEFQFQAAVLFKVVNSSSLQVLGKSTSAKKNYLRGSEVSCSVCTLFKNTDDFAVNSDTIEEIHENKEQIEISKFYERLPNPVLIATAEYLNDEIHHHYRSNDDGDQ